ncbi:MAG: hypothetical protein ACXWQR_02670 [Ktedonobacterales bacterium]
MEQMPHDMDQPLGPEQTPPLAGQGTQMGEVGVTPMAAGSAPGTQRTEGEGREATHSHPAVTHTHDHYHVTHHHRDGVLGEWEHRTHWHTHEHDHTPLTHSHNYSRDDEEQEHGKEAHIHDHAHPTESPG